MANWEIFSYSQLTLREVETYEDSEFQSDQGILRIFKMQSLTAQAWQRFAFFARHREERHKETTHFLPEVRKSSYTRWTMIWGRLTSALDRMNAKTFVGHVNYGDLCNHLSDLPIKIENWLDIAMLAYKRPNNALSKSWVPTPHDCGRRRAEP